MNENPVDRKATRIQVSAEQGRLDRDAEIERAARRSELAIERDRARIALEKERRLAKQQATRERRYARQKFRAQLSARISKALPTVGRRAMITGPILAPMIVAWIGQISFAMATLGWILIGALAFAAAWELTTAFAAWMYHQARKDGDRGTLFRAATWIFAASAGAMNYWHACPVVTERLNAQDVRHYINLSPTPKAVSYGAMSLVGIALWELYSSLIHRKHLRAEGVVPSARPRFGVARWGRYPAITWTAWSLAIRYGIKTVDEAWSLAVAEIERKARAKDRRPAVRMVVATTVVRTVAASKTKVRLFWTDQSATTLTATVDHPAATTGRSVQTDRPRPTGDHPVATTPSDRSDGGKDHRSRPRRKTTGKTGRSKHTKAVADQSKPQPTAADNTKAVAAYRQSIKDGRPLSQRTLAKQFGFSKTWARDRIQEAGPQSVGGGEPAVGSGAVADPKDHPQTSEVKTG